MKHLTLSALLQR